MAAANLFSNMTIADLEAVLDGCLGVMDVAMTRKMELEGRKRKRRVSLTSLSPDTFSEVVTSVFQELYDAELAAHKLVILKKSKIEDIDAPPKEDPSSDAVPVAE